MAARRGAPPTKRGPRRFKPFRLKLAGIDAATPTVVVFEPPDFNVPRLRPPLRNFDGYTPFVAIVAAAPFTPAPFDIPAAARRTIQASEWSFIGANAPSVFPAFDVPRRWGSARSFDGYTPFVPTAALAVFTPLPFDTPTLRRPVIGFDPYAAFVPAVAAATPVVPSQFDAQPARRRSLDFTAFSPFVPVVAALPLFTPQEFAAPPARQRFALRPADVPFIGQIIPFVALALDRPPSQTARPSPASIDAYVPFTPFAPPPVLVLVPFGDWSRPRVRAPIQRIGFDFNDIGYYTDGPDAQTGRGPLFQWLAGQESYWRS